MHCFINVMQFHCTSTTEDNYVIEMLLVIRFNVF